MNEARISEIKMKLSATVEKEIAKTEKGYLAYGNDGKITFTQDAGNAAFVKEKMIKKFKAQYPNLEYEVEKKNSQPQFQHLIKCSLRKN